MIRRLTREDKAAVARLCDRAVSEDFIPLYFDSFIDQKVGFGFEENGVLVGIVFSSVALDGEAWLFGLRVDPDHQRKGIGRRLTQRALEEISPTCHLVRVGIFKGNHASTTLVKFFGFSPRAGYFFREFKGPPLPTASTARLKRARREALVEVYDRLTADPRLQANNLLLPHFYEWFRLTRESLSTLINNGWVWSVGEQLAVVSTEQLDSEVEISYLSKPCEQVLPAILDRFADRGPIEASLPAVPVLEETLRRLGFVIPGWGSEMTICERPLP